MPWKMPPKHPVTSAYSTSRPAGGVKEVEVLPKGQPTLAPESAAHTRPAGSVTAGPPELIRRGDTVFGSVASSEMMDVPTRALFATLVAITVTEVLAAIDVGATYSPVELMVPGDPAASDHVTACEAAPGTNARNCWVCRSASTGV